MKRFWYNCALVLALLYAPWWVLAVLGGVGVFLFSFYIEILIAGILYDLLYGILGGVWTLSGMLAFVTSILLYVGVMRFKKNLRYSDNAFL